MLLMKDWEKHQLSRIYGIVFLRMKKCSRDLSRYYMLEFFVDFVRFYDCFFQIAIVPAILKFTNPHTMSVMVS